MKVTKMSYQRWGNCSNEKIDAHIVKNTPFSPFNTIRNKQSIWKQFMDFCRARKYNFTKDTGINTIADILKDYAFNMKKRNGEEYKESVIKTIWNTVGKCLQEKYYTEFEIKFDPFHDIEFKMARNARDTKRKELQHLPETRKRSAIAFATEELTKMQTEWNENTPECLQKKFYNIAANDLAWRGNGAAFAMTYYFAKETDNFAIPSLYEEVKVKKEIEAEEETTLVEEEILEVKEEMVVKEEIDDYFEEKTGCSKDIEMIEEKRSNVIVRVKEENEYKLKHEHLLAELNTQKLQIEQLLNDSEKKNKTISDLQGMLSTVVKENNTLKEQIVHLENYKETKNKTISDLEEMLAKLFQEYNTQKQQLEQFKRDSQQPNKSLVKEESMQCEDLQEKNGQSESDGEDTVSLSVSLQRLEKEHNSQKEQLIHLEKDCDEINKTVSDLEEQVYKLSEALNDENALLMKVFSKCQRRKLQNKYPLIWSKDDMSKSLKLLSLSRRSYKYIRKELNYPLPHLVTIRKWAEKHNRTVFS